ncbi:MAG: SDR family oxidoreductase [Planctomycetota bacterium]|nr:MAG: SDR family oxidoreductase [Planctomycetota bacterium]
MKTSSRVAIITGGGTGVGQATAQQLAGQGWSVAVVYSRSRVESEETVAGILATGGQAIAIAADVAEDAACRAMVTSVLQAWGRIDLLVNCAGTTEFIPFADLEQVTDDVWLRLYQVNVMGAFHCARAVQEPLRAAGGGQIINISSVAAQLGQGSSIPYCCSKAALDNLTVSLARTLAPQIRVNGIAPGFIAGRWTQSGLGDRYHGLIAAYEQTLPLGRVCTPADIAEGVLSLVNGSLLVTGQTLTVDGGMMISGFQVKFS